MKRRNWGWRTIDKTLISQAEWFSEEYIMYYWLDHHWIYSQTAQVIISFWEKYYFSFPSPYYLLNKLIFIRAIFLFPIYWHIRAVLEVIKGRVEWYCCSNIRVSSQRMSSVALICYWSFLGINIVILTLPQTILPQLQGSCHNERFTQKMLKKSENIHSKYKPNIFIP